MTRIFTIDIRTQIYILNETKSVHLGPYYFMSRKLIPPSKYSIEAQGLRIEDLRCILMLFRTVLIYDRVRTALQILLRNSRT
jgi:hypothetical protein